MLLAEVLDEFADLADLVRVEADGRLIEDEQVGVADEGIREADALAVALGKRADDLALHVGEAGEFLDLADAAANFAAREALEGRRGVPGIR